MKFASRGARSAILLVLFALAFGAPLAAQSGTAKNKGKDKKKDNGTSLLLIHVVGGPKAVPVPNASVYLHFREKAALLFLLHRKKKIELDLKTDNNGYASFPEMPRAKVLIQVVASGWQSFGEYYALTGSRQTIHIKLQRPKTHWY